jgi:periplasmic divalent cation tolerance protein
MSVAADRFLIVLTTTGSEEQGLGLAHALVERRLAACVNIVQHGCSVYRWKGKIAEEAERLLVIKTEKRLFPALREAIRELHSYELPEVIALPLADGDPEYLEWLASCLQEVAD